MAGDWIKVEVGTASKAEVLRMSEMLGMSRRECMGLLVDYWSWLDANARTEFVRNLSRKSLDDVLNCPGFSACLESVGWAKWDESGWQMTVSNYEHHNSSSAKTRAYDQKRKSGQRRDKTGTKPGPEKRREEITTEREIAGPTDEHRQIAKTLAVDCDAEWLKYRDHQKNAKNKHADLKAGFRNWLRRASEFRPPPRSAGRQDARAAVAGQIYGVTNERPNERVIDGEAERVA